MLPTICFSVPTGFDTFPITAKLPSGKVCYPLVNKIEHSHLGCWSTDLKWWFSIVVLVYQRVMILPHVAHSIGSKNQFCSSPNVSFKVIQDFCHEHPCQARSHPIICDLLFGAHPLMESIMIATNNIHSDVYIISCVPSISPKISKSLDGFRTVLSSPVLLRSLSRCAGRLVVTPGGMIMTLEIHGECGTHPKSRSKFQVKCDHWTSHVETHCRKWYELEFHRDFEIAIAVFYDFGVPKTRISYLLGPLKSRIIPAAVRDEACSHLVTG